MFGAFLTGAAGYPLLEIIWRRRTHYSMALAGGCSMMLLRHLASWRKPGLFLRSCIGGAGITVIEYAAGRIWNREHQVWDYRRMPLNFQGQICLPYSLIWCGLSAAALLVQNRNINKSHGQSSQR